MSPLEHDIVKFRDSLMVPQPLPNWPVFSGRSLDLDSQVSRKAFTAAFVKLHQLSEADLAALDGAVSRHVAASLRGLAEEEVGSFCVFGELGQSLKEGPRDFVLEPLAQELRQANPQPSFARRCRRAG